jgi:hypothetical protein
MTEWIYESPDNGKTVTRRIHGDRDGVSKSLMIAHNIWWDLSNLQKISQQLIKDQQLRDDNPVLQDLWEQYQTMKSLLMDK